MGAVLQRLNMLIDRVNDLTPVVQPIKQVMIDRNRERAVAGVDAHDRALIHLAPSTLKHRHGTGPPLAPMTEDSHIVLDYQVDATITPTRLSFRGGWPTFHIMDYHCEGGPNLPIRNPLGFRNAELDRIRGILRNHLIR